MFDENDRHRVFCTHATDDALKHPLYLYSYTHLFHRPSSQNKVVIFQESYQISRVSPKIALSPHHTIYSVVKEWVDET